MKATDQLKTEHEGIQIMLKVLGTVVSKIKSKEGFDEKEFEGIIEFLKVFVDRCHHGKEEDLLFPAMEKAGVPNDGGPIGQMLVEHQQGRRHVLAMEDGLRAFRAGLGGADVQMCEEGISYTELMTQHIVKENTILFPMADSLLSVERQDSLFEEFEKLEEEKIGKGVHEQFHRRLEDLAKIYVDEDQTKVLG